MKSFFSMLATLLVGGSTVFAQYTNILENATTQRVFTAWDTGSNLWVGDQTSNNVLFVLNGGSITNGTGYIGNGAVANNNAAQVQGATAVWINTGDLFVGNAGSSNLLNIIAGGTVSNANSFVGALAGASNNAVRIFDNDSEWVNTGTLQVGALGNGSNSVSVFNGGTVIASNLVVHAGNKFNLNSDGTLAITGDFDWSVQTNFNWNPYGTLAVQGNLAGIDDLAGTNLHLAIAGGTWTNAAADRYIGKSGFGNVLSIINGGQVDNATGIIGYATNANGNLAAVNGSNSVWNNSGDFFVGYEGSANQLQVLNGGTVTGAAVTIGFSTNAFNNAFFLTGSNSTLHTTGAIVVGAAGSDNRLEIFEAARAQSSGGTIGATSNARNNDVTVSGSNSAWNMSGDLLVGEEGSGNTLTISDGGGVTNHNGFVGRFATASSNAVTVSGTGSQWVNTGALNVGATSNAGNRVSVSADGLVQAPSLVIASGNSFSLNRSGTLELGSGFNVSTAGFNWNAGGILSVGGALSGMATNNSGTILAGEKRLVLNGGSLTASTNLIIGYESSGNTLAITNGGGAANVNGYIGRGATAANNSVLVSDAGSAWTNSGSLYVGVNAGAGNSLTVSNNAWVYVGGVDTNLTGGGIAVVGDAELVVGNQASVWAGDGIHVGTGTVSVLNGGSVTAGAVELGAVGVFNLDGALMVNGAFDAEQSHFNWNDGADLTVGGALTLNHDLGGSNKTLNVDGGSWNRGGDLRVDGYNTRLSILNGGSLTNAAGYIGSTSNDWKNAVVVDGSNSVWSNTGDLHVGFQGSENSLTISNGGRVANTNGYIGYASTTMVNAVSVSGTNSVWSNSGNLYVGYEGGGNSLDITGGAMVENFDGFIGTGSNSSANTVTVDDGSVWNNSGNLAVGGAGSNNKLFIQGGSVVSNATGYVGQLAGSANNRVEVLEAGSVWNNSGILYVGGGGPNGNSVVVEQYGRVNARQLVITDGNSFVLNNNGTLALDEGFDVSQYAGFHWNFNGRLSVGGLLEGMDVATNLVAGDAAYLSVGRDLTLDGGSWANGDNNLIVGLNDDASRLVLANGGTMDNANGYIGWGSAGDNNSVLVGAGSAWTNHGGGLYVGVYGASTNLMAAGNGNNLTVQDGGWVFVGEGRTNGPSGGLVVASTNGAELVVGRKGSRVEVGQGLYVGVDAGSTGTVSVARGGIISVGELVVATNSMFTLDGTLEISSGFDFDQQGDFVWNDGSSLSVGGFLDGLDSLGGSNRTIGIAGGSWNNFRGVTGIGNTVSITESGQVFSAAAYIGNSTNDWGNTVSASGSGSAWTIATNLVIGGSGATNNTLSVSDRGRVSVGQDLFINPGNTLALASTGMVTVAGNMIVDNATVSGQGTVQFGAGSNLLGFYGTNTQIAAGVLFDGGLGVDTVAMTDSEFVFTESLTNRFVRFENLNLTNSLLAGSGRLDGFQNVGMSGGRIAPSGGLVVDGRFMATDTILHIAALGDRLHVTNALDVSTMGAEISVQDGLKPAQLREVILTADGGLAGTTFDTNKTDFTEHYMLYDFALDYTVATNVTVVSVPAVDGEISTALSYAGLQGVRAGFNGMQGAVFARTKQLRRNSVATDHAIPHEAYLMSQTNAPSGAYGPGDKNTIFGMHFWAEQFGGQGDYNGVGLSDGFTLNNNGTTFGFDRLVGEDLVAGINYTYARSAASATNGDEVDTETYWLGLYSEWLHENGWYVDALAGLGWSNYDTVRTETGYHGIGSFRGTDLAGTIDAGKYLQFGDWALAPYAGLHYLWVKSDGYTEIEEFGNQLQVEGLDVASLDSALGVKLRNRFDTRIGRFQTVGYAEWMYDFINDDISTTLSDGATTVKTAGISPDANLLNAGLGLGWICTDYLEVGIGYDGRFNQNYEEHTGSIMLDVRF